MSRDLGREVPIHRFIEMIGAELEDSPLTPLLIDAAMHMSWILARFSPTLVGMRLDRQYTKIKWEVADEELTVPQMDRFWEENAEINAFLTETSEGMIDPEFIAHFTGRMYGVRASEFEGEAAKLAILHTSGVSLINEKAGLGTAWSTLQTAVWKASKEGRRGEAWLFLLGLLCVYGFCLRQRDDITSPAYRSRGGPSKFGFARWWSRNHKRIDEALSTLGYGVPLPEGLEELEVKQQEIVHTRSFWRDWGTGA